MNKALALIFTPVVLLLIVVIAILAVLFLANPIVLLGITGIFAAVLFFLVVFFAIVAVVTIVGTVYYALRDVGEPSQRSSSSNYTHDMQEEVGKKIQKLK